MEFVLQKYMVYFLLFLLLTPFWAKELNLTDKQKDYLNSKDDIKVQVQDDWAPYNFVKDQEATGFTNDFIKEIQKVLNKKITFVKGYSWNEYLTMLENNKIDFVSNIVETKERKKRFIFTNNSIFGTFKSLFYQNNKSFKDLKDLNNKKLGLVKGNYEEEIIKSDYPKIELITYTSNKKLIEGLLNNDVEAIIGNGTVLNYLIKENFLTGIDSINLINKNLPLYPIHFAFKKDNHILKSIMEKAISSIPQENIKKLKEKWSLDINSHNFLNLEERKYLNSSKFTIYSNAKGWLPFIFPKEDGIKGMSIDMWDELVKNTGIKVEYKQEKSFDKLLETFKLDPYAIASPASKTEDRKVYASFTKPYASFPIAIATNIKEDFLIDLKELEGKKVAVGKNYTAHKLLQKHYPKINFVTVESIQKALDMLANGKVYAAADILPVINYEINRYGFTNLKISGTSKFNVDIQIMVNKQSDYLVGILNKLIDSMDPKKKDEIINKWLHSKTEIEKIDYSLTYWIAILSIFIILSFLFRQKILTKQKKEIERQVDIATKDLRELNKIHEETQKLAKIGTLKKNLKNNEYWVSKEFYNIFELENGSIITRDIIMSKVHKKDRRKLLKLFNDNEKFNGKRIKYDEIFVRLECKDGSIKYLDIFLSYEFDEKNEAKEQKATVQDVTEKIKSKLEIELQEKRLIQQSKLASMGEMIGAIAHQWRQPLNELSIRIQKLKYRFADDEENKEYISEFIEKNKKTIDFMSKTIDDFRNFFRIDKEKNRFDINKSIEEVVSILSSQLKNNHIDLILNGQTFFFKGFKTEFQQVIINTISNSKDALVKNKIKNPKIQINIKQGSIEIIDNAGGIESSIIDRIFEPYFTTKEQGEGTGIGLYMSKMIIEDNMGGKIEAKNIEDGLAITITLGD